MHGVNYDLEMDYDLVVNYDLEMDYDLVVTLSYLHLPQALPYLPIPHEFQLFASHVSYAWPQFPE